MNGFFNCIKVNTIDGNAAYIHCDHISAIHGDQSYVKGELVKSTKVCLGTVAVYVKADIDEVYAAIAKVASVPSEVPEVGFPKECTNSDETECEIEQRCDGDVCEHAESYELTKAQSRIIELAMEYNNPKRFDRYSCFREMLTYVSAPKVTTKSGDSFVVADINVFNGSYAIVDPFGDTHDFSDVKDDSFDSLLSFLQACYKWDKANIYACCESTDDECIEIYNKMHSDKKQWILPNTEENLNAFGLSAGELMKSMVNGKYRKDDKYITLEKGELISIEDDDDLYGCFIECNEITGWIYDHPEEVKKDYPHIYEKVFA